MNKLEFTIETAGFHYIIDCAEKDYYFFYDPDNDQFYDEKLDDMDISLLLTDEQLFQYELVNEKPLSVYVFYKILKLFKQRNMIFPSKKFTIEY